MNKFEFKNLVKGLKDSLKEKTFFKDLKELMFEGNLQDKVGNSAIYKKIKKQMVDAGLNDKSQNTILDAVYNSRKKFANLLERIQEGSTAKATLPKEMQNTAGLMGDRMKLMHNKIKDSKTAFWYKSQNEIIKFIKENLFDPHQGLWAETKQNTQFRQDSQKWRGIIGTGFFGLIFKQIYDIIS